MRIKASLAGSALAFLASFPAFLIIASLFLHARPVLAAPAAAQSSAETRQSLEQFLTFVQQAFEKDPQAFEKLYGPSDLVDLSERQKFPRVSAPARIIRSDAGAGKAVVLLTGTVQVEDSGNATFFSSMYSGLYEVEGVTGGWKIARKIPIGVNRLLSHNLIVAVDPASGIRASDDLMVEVVGQDGFWSGLNINAKLAEVLVDGRPAPHHFQSGLLWVKAKPGRRKLRLRYSIAPERVKGGNSAAFLENAGHLRNQYYWHPFFGFGEARSAADFKLTVTIPERYQIALDIPQRTTIRDGIRTVQGRTPVPAEALTMAYDEAWVPKHHKVGGLSFDLFTTPDYEPREEELVAHLSEVWRLFSGRFGTPNVNRVAIIQARARRGVGWHFLSNQAIVTGEKGGEPISPNKFVPQAYFAHEVAHLWVNPEGSLRNFLGEGWATYTESLMLKERFGEDMQRWFWSDHARAIMNRESYRNTPLKADEANAGVSYSKGAWVFKMLEYALGARAFDAGMRAYSLSPSGRAGYKDFVTSFGDQSAVAERFLRPWIEEAGGARLSVQAENGRVVLVQKEPIYWLPRFQVSLEDAAGNVSRVVADVAGERTILPVPADGVSKVRLDPEEEYLLEGPRTFQMRAHAN